MRFVCVAGSGEPPRSIANCNQRRGGARLSIYLPADSWKLNILSGAGYKDPVALRQYARELIQAPFDLSTDPKFRATLITISGEEQVLVATMHHIASDGWSTGILVKEVVELYESFVEQRPSSLQPLPVQYADYAIWQRTYLQGETLNKKLGYWKAKLEHAAALQLPTDYPRPPIQTMKGATASVQLGKDLATRLQLFSNQQGTTLFMTLLAAFKVLLHRYSGQEDITVGTPVANRTQQETSDLIGFFVNTLALRSEVRGEDNFTGLLEQVKATTLDAYTHQDVPFEKVVEAVMTSRDLSRSPLFQVLFVFQNTPDVPQLKFGDVELSAESAVQQTSKFDLSLFVAKHGEGVQVSFEYNTDLYRAETIQQMLSHFEQLLFALLDNPAQRLGSVQMLSKAEKQQLLVDFNDTAVSYAGNESVLSLFENQATRTPDAIALVFENTQVRYRELNERSNQVAHYLREKGYSREPWCRFA